MDPDTFGLLIPDAEEERLMVVFEDALHGLALTGGPELDLGIGGVLGLDADYAPVSSTARRMHHLAAIAGQRVLLTTLDELPQRRLLLVEGDADTATSLRSILRGERVEVVYRRTAIEGLEAAAGHAFDLVVLGAGLPNHAAFDVLATLRSWPQYEARPIVLLTSEDAERVAAYDLGADDCVGTPFNPEVLRARLKALLAG
ncbi:MAG: response regulator [Myxococcota bacterium]